MLLSVERPFVGAFAVVQPGATLLHRNGLVQAVLPASDWNMCKRTIGIPQELGISYAQYTPKHNLPRGGRSAYSVRAGTIGTGTLVSATSGNGLRRRPMCNVTDERVPPRAFSQPGIVSY
jgi:hypothetical protein